MTENCHVQVHMRFYQQALRLDDRLLKSGAGLSPSTVPSVAECVVCLDQRRDAVLHDCKHVCCCYDCACRLKAEDAACPLCRSPILRVNKVATEFEEVEQKLKKQRSAAQHTHVSKI